MKIRGLLLLSSSLFLACSAACSAPTAEEEQAESVEEELVSVTKTITYRGAIPVDGKNYPIELTLNYPSAVILPQGVGPQFVSPQITHACRASTGGALATTRLVIRDPNGTVLVDNDWNASLSGHALIESWTPAECVANVGTTWSMNATIERNGLFWTLGNKTIQVGPRIGLNGNPGIEIHGWATYRRRSDYTMVDLGPDSGWNAKRGVLRVFQLVDKTQLDIFYPGGVTKKITLTSI